MFAARAVGRIVGCDGSGFAVRRDRIRRNGRWIAGRQRPKLGPVPPSSGDFLAEILGLARRCHSCM